MTMSQAVTDAVVNIDPTGFSHFRVEGTVTYSEDAVVFDPNDSVSPMRLIGAVDRWISIAREKRWKLRDLDGRVADPSPFLENVMVGGLGDEE